MLCLINVDGQISQNDFIDRIKGDDRDLEDSDDYTDEKSNIKENERFSLFAEDCFKLGEYRQNVFRYFYPFRLSEDRKNILLTSDISLKNKIYFFLLFCSNLGYLRDYTNEFTSSFENFSHKCFTRILPSHISRSYLFGSSNIDQIQNDDEKSLSFWKKINELADNIKESVVIQRDKLSRSNMGDGGLDIVGWIELGDNCPHKPLFFGQCACTSEWNVKQNSSKYDRWTNFITFSTYPLNFIFIPFAFRGANGDWHEAHFIEKSILFDRLRLIINFIDGDEEFKQYISSPIVDEIINLKESII
jgi:hypothetical protein